MLDYFRSRMVRAKAGDGSNTGGLGKDATESLPFSLGDTLRCRDTGFQGIVHAIFQELGSMMRYHLQPRVDDKGVLPDGQAIDVCSLELVASADPAVRSLAYPVYKFQFQDEVEDPTKKIKGFVVSRCLFKNGCIRYGIQMPAKDGGKVPDIVYSMEAVLQLVKQTKSAVQSKTGGPMEKVPFLGMGLDIVRRSVVARI